MRGDDTVPLAGGVTLTLTEGQTEVSFALVNTSDLAANQDVVLTAAYTTDGETLTSSNNATYTLTDAGAATRTYTGDQHAPVDGDGTYTWVGTSWSTTGTLNGGVAEANFADVITGTSSNDKIDGLGGNDALSGGAGNDAIYGGDGDDLIGGGAGSDHIYGGAGNDFISTSASLGVNQRLKPGETWSAPAGNTVLAQGPGWGVYSNGFTTTWEGVDAPQGTDADFVDAGDGNDWVTARGGDVIVDAKKADPVQPQKPSATSFVATLGHYTVVSGAFVFKNLGHFISPTSPRASPFTFGCDWVVGSQRGTRARATRLADQRCLGSCRDKARHSSAAWAPRCANRTCRHSSAISISRKYKNKRDF